MQWLTGKYIDIRPFLVRQPKPQTGRFLSCIIIIATLGDIQGDLKRLSVHRGAEILAIEVSMTIDSKKFVFCTVYRVGNLDEPNMHYEHYKGAFTYDVSSRGGRGFQNADGCWQGGRGLSLADVSKNTLILAKIVSNQAGLSLCVRLLH